MKRRCGLITIDLLFRATGWDVHNERMLALRKQLASEIVPRGKKLLQRQIAATDRQIDKLVYELYGLSVEEIKIVGEGANQ